MALQTFPAFTQLKGITYPIIKVPQWDTDTQMSLAGKRTTLGRRIYPRYLFELTYTFLRSDTVNLEWQTMVAFWNLVGGSRDLFKFTDPQDTVATNVSFGTGDGVTTQFQLLRPIVGLSSITWIDPVFSATIATIFKNGVGQTLGVDYTVGTYDLITFTAAPAPAAALTWTGTYSFLCRFDEDVMGFEEFANNFWELKKIKFSSELF